jgi:predicted DNA-binding protein with PD1-like motif
MMKPALFSLLFVLPALGAESFGGAQIAEVYRVHRGDLLLESIQDVIHKHGIADGAVLTAAGSLQKCTFHRVKSIAEKPEDEFITVKEPMEILNINGMIAGAEPHVHLTLSGANGAFGGHREGLPRPVSRRADPECQHRRETHKDGVPLQRQ